MELNETSRQIWLINAVRVKLLQQFKSTFKTTVDSDQIMNYLLVFTDTTLAAKSLLLTINDQDIVPSTSAGQVLPTLLTAIHYQTVGHSVSIKAVVTAQLMSHIFKANFMANLKEKQAKF